MDDEVKLKTKQAGFDGVYEVPMSADIINNEWIPMIEKRRKSYEKEAIYDQIVSRGIDINCVSCQKKSKFEGASSHESCSQNELIYELAFIQELSDDESKKSSESVSCT